MSNADLPEPIIVKAEKAPNGTAWVVPQDGFRLTLFSTTYEIQEWERLDGWIYCYGFKVKKNGEPSAVRQVIAAPTPIPANVAAAFEAMA